MRSFHSRGAGFVDGGSVGIDGYRHGHVLDLELIDGFHAEVGKGQHAWTS